MTPADPPGRDRRDDPSDAPRTGDRRDGGATTEPGGRPVDQRHPRRDGWLAAGVATGTTVAAVLAKARCGVPADDRGAYLGWCYTDIVPLWTFERLDVGAVPYLDHPVEYPPLTGLAMWLAALPSDSAAAFLLWTAALLVVCAAATGWLLGRALGWRRALVFAAAPTLLVSGALNWDLPSVLLATAGLLAHRRARDGAAGVLLGLGTAAKAWPALLVPAVLLAAWRLRGASAGRRTLAGAVLAWAAVNVPVAVVAPEGWWRFVALSRERPVDWDSLWRVVPVWLGRDVPDVATANLAVGVVTLLGVAALLAVAVRTTPPATWHLVALPVVAWFLLAGKVWSPQFTLWLLPLLALAAPGPVALVALAVADVGVHLFRFPFLASVLGLDGWPARPFEVAVVVRAGVVAVVAWTAWRRATHGVPAAGQGPGSAPPATPIATPPATPAATP